MCELKNSNTLKIQARLAEASQLGLETRYVYRVTQVANLGQGRQVGKINLTDTIKSYFL